VKALVSRTGYTGEDGFELYISNEDAIPLWERLLEAGKEHGLVPAGLGARDTLRFEARLPLYGQELSPEISPLAAGLGMFVKLDKGDFIGREALAAQKAAGLKRKLVGIEMIDRGIPRAHYPVYSPDGQRIGEVTTGTQSPTLKRNVGLALLAAEYTALDTEVLVDIRGKRLRAKVAATPFYKRPKH
jgi:aminomethyltransferase